MPEWLSNLTKPETLSLFGALALTAGVIRSQFMKGLKEGKEKTPEVAAKTDPAWEHPVAALNAAVMVQHLTLRQIMEAIEHGQAKLRTMGMDLTDIGEHLRRLERSQSDTHDEIVAMRRDVENVESIVSSAKEGRKRPNSDE